MFNKYLSQIIQFIVSQLLNKQFAAYKQAVNMVLDILVDVAHDGKDLTSRDAAAQALLSQLNAKGITLLDLNACGIVVDASVAGLEKAGAEHFLTGWSDLLSALQKK